MEILSDLRYTRSHEWAKLQGDVCTVGITDFAVEQLNKEIVNVDLPSVGDKIDQEDPFGMLDAVKAAFDLYAPMGGTVESINEKVMDDPTLVARGPYTDGWMVKIKIKDKAEWDNLLDAEAYRKHVESEAH